MVFGIIPERRSASLRKERSASPESPIKFSGDVLKALGGVKLHCEHWSLRRCHRWRLPTRWFALAPAEQL
jgi:hypothetical protein